MKYLLGEKLIWEERPYIVTGIYEDYVKIVPLKGEGWMLLSKYYHLEYLIKISHNGQ